MKDLYFYPRYVTRWRESETRLRLTHEQRSVYWEVIDYLYLNGGSVKNDEDMLTSITASDKKTFRRAWPHVKMLFTERDGRLEHPIVSEVLHEQSLKREKRADAGRAGGAKKASNARILLQQTASNGASNALPEEKRREYTTPPTPSSDPSSALTPADSAPPVRGREKLFPEFWSVVWAKIGRGAALKSWNRKATNRDTALRIIAAAKRQGPVLIQAAAREGRQVIHPATWLNQERYDDESSLFAVELDPEPKYSSEGRDPNAYYVLPPWKDEDEEA